MTMKKRIEDCITDTVCGCYGVSPDELRSTCRCQKLGVARKMLAYLLHRYTPHNHRWIGLFLRRSSRFASEGIAQTEWEIEHIRSAKENYEYIIENLKLTKEDEVNRKNH